MSSNAILGIQNGRRRPFVKKMSVKWKFDIELKMVIYVIEVISQQPAILWEKNVFLKLKYFRVSKMAVGGHCVNKLNKCCLLIWNGEKCDQKRPPDVKVEVAYWYEMTTNAIDRLLWFSVIHDVT